MDDNPGARTVDRTSWPEARPPHLPDRLTSISPWVLPFLVVAVVQLWVISLDQPFGTDPGSPLEYWFDMRHQFVGIAGSLIGLALFLRHPDARTALPQVAAGALILLLAQAMRLLDSTVEPFLVALAPPSDDLTVFAPLVRAYSILTSIVGIFGMLLIATGLSAARRHEDVRPLRALAVLLTGIAIVSAAYTLLGYAMVRDYVGEFSIVLVVAALLINLLEALASAYLVIVSLGGWLAREEPRSGWRLAALGASLIWLPALAMPFVGGLPLSQEGLWAVIGLISDGALVGWVVLVIAFALGLPWTAPVPDDEVARATPDRPAVTTPGS